MATRTIPTTDTAKFVRAALRAAFPRTKFSVRSAKYAGGSSIDVHWTDGPTEPQVTAITCLYRGATFDGMTDMKSYHDAILSTDGGAEAVHFGVDFIPSSRRISDAFRRQLEQEIADFTGEPFDNNATYPVVALPEGRREDGSELPCILVMSSHTSTYGSDLVHRLAYGREVAR
jgi:hypothetical protein